MFVKDLQQFLSKFTEATRDGKRQGNAVSEAKVYVEKNGFLEEIIRAVSNRTYQIKNAIEWNKFQAGFG